MSKRYLNFLFALIIPIIFFLVAFITISDYGINWDEPYHFRRGQAFLQYFLTGKKTYGGMPKYPPLKGTADDPTFRDSQKNFEAVQKDPSLFDPSFRRSYYQDDAWNGVYHIDIEKPSGHPALNGILAAAFNKIFYQKLGILGDLESYHLFEITVAFLLVLVVSIFMWKEFGMVEGVISALALSTYPLFLGEQHFNIKDPIEAAFYTFTLISIYKAVTRKNYVWVLISAFTFALALSVKFNVLFIVFPVLTWMFIYFLKNKADFKFEKKFYAALFVSPLIVLGLFIFFFSPIWKNPAEGILRIIGFYSQVGYSASQAGSFNLTPLTWILFTTPIITLILFVAIVAFPKKLLEHKMLPLLLLFTLFVTILRVSLPGAVSYGGVRQIMEYVPVMAMLAGLGGANIYNLAKRRLPKTFAFLIVILPFAFLILNLHRIHPNENVYFNELIGGINGAAKAGIDSWGDSYGNAYYPAIEWLNKNAEENARLTLPVGSISNIPRFKLRPDISLSSDYWSGPEHNGEYVLELTYNYPQMQWFSLNYLNSATKPVYEVKVDRIAIAKLWKNSPEFILPKFRSEKTVIGAKLDSKPGILKIILPKPEKVMKLSLTQPIQNCNQTRTGYVDTSIDGTSYVREAEDIARDQLKHAQLKGLESEFSFYFVARKAKFVRIHIDDQNSCLLKAKTPVLTVLSNN